MKNKINKIWKRYMACTLAICMFLNMTPVSAQELFALGQYDISLIYDEVNKVSDDNENLSQNNTIPVDGKSSLEENPGEGEVSQEENPEEGEASQEENPEEGEASQEESPGEGETSQEGNPEEGETSQEENPEEGEASQEESPEEGEASQDGNPEEGETSQEENPEEGETSQEESSEEGEASQEENPEESEASQDEETDEGEPSQENDSDEGEEENQETVTNVVWAAAAGNVQTQSLTLEQAINLAQIYQSGNSLTQCPITQNGDSLNIYNGEGLILLSLVNPQEYSDKNLVFLLQGINVWDIKTPITIDDSTYSFLGLGNLSYPYKGKVSVDSTAQAYPIETTKPLFQCISESAFINSPLRFELKSPTNLPLFAELVAKDESADSANLVCNISLRAPSGGTIGGLIGELQENADVTINVTLENSGIAIAVTGASDIGMFCNVMKNDASLTVSLANSGGNSITITSENGNAGGFVGSATDAVITQVGERISSLSVTAGTTKAAGGLVGEYTNTKNNGLVNLGQFQIDNVDLGRTSGYAGGVFGMLKNSGVFVMQGNDKTDSYLIHSKLSGSGQPKAYGGAVGIYIADSLDQELEIKEMAIYSQSEDAPESYGGVIGSIESDYYVSITDVQVRTKNTSQYTYGSCGGFVGKIIGQSNSGDPNGILNICDVAASCEHDIGGNNSYNKRGGLVGYLESGVVRLAGVIDFSGSSLAGVSDENGLNVTPGERFGQLIGENNNGLIYAVGDGNGKYGDQTGWLFKRSKKSKASDIGNWGQILRLDGVVLKETTTDDADALIYYSEENHSVTIKSSEGFKVSGGTGSGESYSIKNTRDFAAYTLAYNYAGAESNTLKFVAGVNPNNQQNVSLDGTEATIDLTGTGIMGIGRDTGNGNNDWYTNKSSVFTGTFNGNNHTICIDMGAVAYGVKEVEGEKTPEGAGGLQVFDDSHSLIGLFAGTGADTIIKNLTITGGAVTYTAKNQSNIRFLSALVARTGGNITFEDVSVSANLKVYSQRPFYQAGFISQVYATECTIEFMNCSWNGELYNDSTYDNNQIGGLIADANTGQSIEVSNCTLSGSIVEGERQKAKASAVGGMIAQFRYDKNKQNALSLINVALQEESIDVKSGSLLGYFWPKTNVTFGSDDSLGVTVKGCTLKTTNNCFGGLVHQATGYWDATGSKSIVFQKLDDKSNVFEGKSSAGNISGLLVQNGLYSKDNVATALYLEAGTWGNSSPDASFCIDTGAVVLSIGKDNLYFDELVGVTIDSVEGHNNAVVSLDNGSSDNEGSVDVNSCNTYQGQISATGKYKNQKSRYYYNLNRYRNNYVNSQVDPGTLDSADKVLLWSVSQYAAQNIREYFCKKPGDEAKIWGDINLSGYSYYPVTSLGKVNVGTTEQNVTLTFNMQNIEEAENGNRKPSEKEYQHYMMQYGLLYNVDKDVALNGLSLTGTIGSLQSNGGSGALIVNKAYGDVTSSPAKVIKISLSDVTLGGIRVYGISDATAYAPLLINRMESGVTLDVSCLKTAEGYVTDGQTAYVATSLIGEVGNATAKMIRLSFTQIALDGRKPGENQNTVVYNNGTEEVNYHTTHTIFTHATLLESFQYSSESSGTYNFYSTENQVTYGVELSNNGSSGRNPEKQYQYYDGGYITDQATSENITVNSEYVKNRYGNGNREEALFVPYVRVTEDFSQYHELDINQKTSGLIKGCGTYGDPYLIENGQQWIDLAAFLEEPGATIDFQVSFCFKVENAGTDQATGALVIGQNTEGYHNYDQSVDGYRDISFQWNGSEWSQVESQTGKEITATVTSENAILYLQNAYYKLSDSIVIPLKTTTYKGVGTESHAFCGVIEGDGKTVSFSGTRAAQGNFGGLVSYSCGSVIRNITVDYTGAESITMSNSAVPNSSNHPFFGGVVGYCIGGDTIIEKASVKYPDTANITLTGDNGYDRLIAAGGYVGIVGGARNDTGYEPYGGGVIFRDMENTIHNFKTLDDRQLASSNYFYCNPYVGRVLDGYVCYANRQNESTTDNDNTSKEVFTLDNTDKNYTIPDLAVGTDDLIVEFKDAKYTVTVKSDQGLWLLSAIVNSGAGAMDGNGEYRDVDKKSVSAYQNGKTRSVNADYSKIGAALNEDAKSKALADELVWGGKSTNNRIPYLVTAYTSAQNKIYYASRISGRKDTSQDASLNQAVELCFGNANVDMSSYGNGFRGIGASYGDNTNVWNNESAVTKLYRRTLMCSSVQGVESGTTIKLAMDRHDYSAEYIERANNQDAWANQGAGLFIGFSFSNGCSIKDITLSGKVRESMYQISDGVEIPVEKKNLDVAVGGFAGRTINSSGKLKFSNFNLDSLNIYGGNSTGGAFGLTEKTGGKKEISFFNWSINDLKVSKWITKDGSTGGLVGWQYSGNTLTIGAAETSDNTSQQLAEVNKLTINALGTAADSNNVGGLVGASNGCEVIIKNIDLEEANIYGTKVKEVGGLVAAVKDKALTVQNCRINKSTINAKDCNFVGGLVGYNNNILNITNSAVESTKISGIERGDCNIGGVAGRSSTMNATDVKLSAMTVEVDRTNCNAGLLIGRTENTVKGYRILAGDSSVTLTTTGTANNIGRWIGNSNGKSIELVAVAANKNTLPQNKDLGGNVSPVNTKIVYADFTARTEDFLYPNAMAVDSNPDSGIKVKDGNTALGLTGNGVGYGKLVSDGEQMSIGAMIAQECSGDAANKTYYNAPNISSITNHDNTVYLTDYHTEEIGTSVPTNIDFPILVVNSNVADADTQIWNYIAALTNVGSITGYTAVANVKRMAKAVTVYTCLWDETASLGSGSGCFVKKDSCDTLSIENNTFSMTGVYDNQKSQFTLVDVFFADPTGKNKSGYHLYIPVLVKKVLEVEFRARFLAGTNYYMQAYKDASVYATVDFDEPVTAYMEYIYNRTGSEWQEALDHGENLLWSYEKVVDLAQGNVDQFSVPNGTRLTLVDRQTGKSYTYVLGAADQVHEFPLASMKDVTGHGFEPIPICDLLEITASAYTGEGTAYVEEADSTKYTVKIGQTYYRKAEDEEVAEKFTLTVNDSLSSVKEGYYLTLQIPKKEGISSINNYLNNHSVILSSGTGAPAAQIMGVSSSSYVVYAGVSQTFTMYETKRVKQNGEESNDTGMENGDSIKVSLSCELALTEEGKEKFASLGPKQYYHRFEISMKEYLKGVVSDMVIGAEQVSYTYQVRQGDNEIYRDAGSRLGTENLSVFELTYGSEELKKALLDGNVSITAEVVFTYPLAGSYFPSAESLNNPNGIYVTATSRGANEKAHLSITQLKSSAAEADKRYHTAEELSAKLSYFTYDKESYVDVNQQLGINPSDVVNNLSSVIYTQGDYDYSAFDASELETAKYISYQLQLYCKDEDGSYHEQSPLAAIDTYLSEVQTEDNHQFVANVEKNALTYIKDFTYDRDAMHEFERIRIVPLTGTKFEENGFTYANYKLRLTVVLLDGNYDEVTNTKATDYIIYTNAKIHQQIFR